MKKLLKTMFLMIVVGLVVAAVASYTSKKRLESKSDDEIREFLARKLDGKVGEEQLATIQNAVIGGIRGKSSAGDGASASDDAPPADEDADETDAQDADETDAEADEDAADSQDDAADEDSEEVSAE
jgi:hypothetical protein